MAEQPQEDADDGGEQRPHARAARDDPGHLRLLVLGRDPHAVAQLAEAAAGQVPAAQQRRAADPLQRDEVGPHRRAGERRAIGLAHQRDVAGQPALTDVAQVGKVVAPLARDAVAVGPDAVPRAAEERVALVAQRDRDVERLEGRAGAAPRLPRSTIGTPSSGAATSTRVERVGMAREDAAVGGAVEAGAARRRRHGSGDRRRGVSTASASSTPSVARSSRRTSCFQRGIRRPSRDANPNAALRAHVHILPPARCRRRLAAPRLSEC